MRPISRPTASRGGTDVHEVLATIVSHLDDHLSAARSKASIIYLFGQLNIMLADSEQCHVLKKALLSTDFMLLFLRKLDVVIRFESLSEYSIKLMHNFCFNDELGQEVIDQFLTGGGIIFVLSIIKNFLLANPRICEYGGRIMTVCIRSLHATRNLTTFTNYNEQLPLTHELTHHPRFDKVVFSDLKQQLVLHGIASMLPKLINSCLDPLTDVDYFAALMSSACIVAVECSSEVCGKLISVDNYSTLSACVLGLGVHHHTIPVDAATVLLGSIFASGLTIRKLTELNAWPLLTNVLAHPHNSFAMPKKWATNLLEYLKKMKGKELLAVQPSKASQSIKMMSQKINTSMKCDATKGSSVMGDDQSLVGGSSVSDSLHTAASFTHFSDGRTLKLTLSSALLSLSGYKESLPNIYLASKHSPAYREGQQLSAEAVQRSMRKEYDFDGESTYFDNVGPDIQSVHSGAGKQGDNDERKEIGPNHVDAISDAIRALGFGGDNSTSFMSNTSDVVDDFNSDLYSMMSSHLNPTAANGAAASSSNNNDATDGNTMPSPDGGLQQGSLSTSWASNPLPKRKKKLVLKPVAQRLLQNPLGLPVDTDIIIKHKRAHKELPRFLPKALGGVGIVKKKMATMAVKETNASRSRSRSPSPSQSLKAGPSIISARSIGGGSVDNQSQQSLTSMKQKMKRDKLLQQREDKLYRELYEQESRAAALIAEKQTRILECGTRSLLFCNTYAAEDLFANADHADFFASETLDDLHQTNSFADRLQAMTDAVESLSVAYRAVNRMDGGGGSKDGSENNSVSGSGSMQSRQTKSRISTRSLPKASMSGKSIDSRVQRPVETGTE